MGKLQESFSLYTDISQSRVHFLYEAVKLHEESRRKEMDKFLKARFLRCSWWLVKYNSGILSEGFE